MRIHKFIVRTYLHISRWNFVGKSFADRTIVVGTPHTPNRDGIFMALSSWSIERSFHFLVEDSIVKKPTFGAFVKWIDAIGADRTATRGIAG